MPFYAIRVRAGHGWSGQHRDVALAWLDRHYRAGDPVMLDVYPEGIDEMPTLAIVDPARVFEYLSGGRRCGPPVSSDRPLSWAWRCWYRALYHFGTRHMVAHAVRRLGSTGQD